MFPTDVVPLSTQDNHEQSFVVRKNDELLLFSLVFFAYLQELAFANVYFYEAI